MSSDKRGAFVDWVTQCWVRWTGRRVSLAEHAWLDGPTGAPDGIGARFFEDYASTTGLSLAAHQPSGLLPDLEALRQTDFDPSELSPLVIDFYTSTSAYDLDVWSQWSTLFRPFGWALAQIFSRRLQQLNVPLSSLDTSRGMTSSVVPLVARDTGRPIFTAWVRQLVATGHVIYVGAYSTCVVPDGPTPCVRVVFPLPNGNAIVLMRPVRHADGSLTLVSAGQSFGSPGFYFTVREASGAVSARYLRALRERIHVYEADGLVRADHDLALWGATFLRLHYRMRKRDAQTSAA